MANRPVLESNALPKFADCRAVIFDLDDTLINWRQAEHQAMADLARIHFAPLGIAADRVHSVYAAVMEENMRAFRATQKWWFIADRLRLLVERLDSEVSAEDLAASFKQHVNGHLALLPGATEALLAARRSRQVALLTNGPGAVQRPKVEHMGLAHHFHFVGITGEIGHWKPSHKAFQHVLDQLGVTAAETVMVGDSLDFDIVPAKQLGMTTVWVDPARGTHPSADLVVATPGELAAHFS